MFRMGILKRSILTGATALALTAGGVATAAVTTAAPASCPSGSGCAWKDQNYLTAGRSSPVVTFVNSIRDFTTIRGAWDNQVTSIFNNGTSGKRIAWYTDIHYGGSALTLAKGQGVPQLHLTSSLFNDRISSAKFV